MCLDGWGTVEEIAVHGLASSSRQWEAFTAWARSAYALTDDSWDPAGAGDPNDGTLPYGKVLTSIFLLCYALRDDYSRQWHSTEDYVSCSRAAGNRFHGPFYTRFIEYDGSSEADAETGRTAARDRTNLHCPLFNAGVGSPSNFPSHRAGVLLHEAWHHWEYAHGFDTSHPSGGSCTGAECDWYYFHGVGAFDFGTLDRWSTAGDFFRFHSPYQVETEFFADLAELCRPWVPAAVAQTARDHGNTLLAKYCVNGVGYRIGQPRPW